MPQITINGHSLHYQQTGQGPALLFGHSYLWDHQMWQPQVKALSQYFTCIVPDLWGHGQSAGLTQHDYTLMQIADDMLTLMQQLGHTRFSVIGLSVGGMWGAELAIANPDAVDKLILMDTYLGAEPKETQQQYLAILDAVAAAGHIPDALIENIAPLFFSQGSMADNSDFVEEFKASLRDFPREHIQTLVNLGRTIFTRPDRLEALKAITNPTTVIVGEEDIPRPVTEAEEMTSLIPKAQLAIIQQAGHICNIEKPEIISNLLLHILQA